MFQNTTLPVHIRIKATHILKLLNNSYLYIKKLHTMTIAFFEIFLKNIYTLIRKKFNRKLKKNF